MVLPRHTFDLVVQYMGLEKDIKSFCELMAKRLRDGEAEFHIIRFHDMYNPESGYMRKITEIQNRSETLEGISEEEQYLLHAYECCLQDEVPDWRWAVAKMHFTQCHAMTKFLLHQELTNGPHAYFARIWCKHNFTRRHIGVLRNPVLYLDHIPMFSCEWSKRIHSLHATPFEAYDRAWKKQREYFEDLKKRHFKCLDEIRKVPVHCIQNSHYAFRSLNFDMRTKVDEHWKWLNQCY